MDNKFYNYVQEIVKGIPNSAFLDVYSLNINEDNFLLWLKEKYELYLLFFDKSMFFEKIKINPSEEKKCIETDETISYCLKLNNQIFMEYKTYNKNKNFFVDDIKNYNISSINIYASNSHKEEFIKLLEYINEYIKKNKK